MLWASSDEVPCAKLVIWAAASRQSFHFVEHDCMSASGMPSRHTIRAIGSCSVHSAFWIVTMLRSLILRLLLVLRVTGLKFIVIAVLKQSNGNLEERIYDLFVIFDIDIIYYYVAKSQSSKVNKTKEKSKILKHTYSELMSSLLR